SLDRRKAAPDPQARCTGPGLLPGWPPSCLCITSAPCRGRSSSSRLWRATTPTPCPLAPAPQPLSGHGAAIPTALGEILTFAGALPLPRRDHSCSPGGRPLLAVAYDTIELMVLAMSPRQRLTRRWFMRIQRRLIAPAFLIFTLVACSSEEQSEKRRLGGLGESCQARNDCAPDLACLHGACQLRGLDLKPTGKECYVIECRSKDDCCADFFPLPQEDCEWLH